LPPDICKFRRFGGFCDLLGLRFAQSKMRKYNELKMRAYGLSIMENYLMIPILITDLEPCFYEAMQIMALNKINLDWF
jgi:hypothetical protein